MSINNSGSKRSSIVGYLTDKNADDLNSLKEFLELVYFFSNFIFDFYY